MLLKKPRSKKSATQRKLPNSNDKKNARQLTLKSKQKFLGKNCKSRKKRRRKKLRQTGNSISRSVRMRTTKNYRISKCRRTQPMQKPRTPKKYLLTVMRTKRQRQHLLLALIHQKLLRRTKKQYLPKKRRRILRQIKVRKTVKLNSKKTLSLA